MRHLRYSDASQKLIDKYVEEKRPEAFELARVLLEITPDPKAGLPQKEGEIFKPMLKPKTRLDEWQYGAFFKNHYGGLLNLDSNKALDLVCGLLSDYVRFSYPENEREGNYDDISQVWRPAIEDHEQNHQYPDIDNALVNAVRDTALTIIKKTPEALGGLMTNLESKKWLIFRRISLYLLSQNPSQEKDLTVKKLTDMSLFDDPDFQHEYAFLAKKGFNLLTSDQQEIIMSWISQANKIKERVKDRKKSRSISDDETIRIIENWQRDKLSYFKDNLSPDWKKRYNELVIKFGEPEHPDFSTYSRSYVGPTATKTARELIDMEPAKMFDFLSSWEPKEKNVDFGPTKEGQGRELTAAIKLEPDHFFAIVDGFKGLDPTYVRAYLDAFYNLAQHNETIDWKGILSLCYWVVLQPREIVGRKGGIMDQDPDWGWARRTVSSLITRGLNNNTIPFSSRGLVWNILELLTEDPNPTPAEESTKEDTYSDDAFTLSINTVRGEAISGVVEYGLWVYRNIQKTEGGKEKIKSGFGIMPEIKAVLEKHLKSEEDPSIAVRSVYGRYFPWLLLLDSTWTVSCADMIFPPGQFNTPLYHAAWQAYICYAGAFSEPFDVLKGKYREAVKNIGKVKKESRLNEDERLVQHLMIYYWIGKMDLSDSLLSEFWDMPNGELKKQALDYIGRSLLDENLVLEPEVQNRLKKLWEDRITKAETAVDKTPYKAEISSFGWWFASGKFDIRWSCEQYIKALEIGEVRTDLDFFVSRQLVKTVKEFPIEAIKILEKIVIGDRRTWIVYGEKEDVRSIILTALQSPKSEAQKAAKELTNRLVAQGHVEFRDLLEINNSKPNENIAT